MGDPTVVEGDSPERRASTHCASPGAIKLAGLHAASVAWSLARSLSSSAFSQTSAFQLPAFALRWSFGPMLQLVHLPLDFWSALTVFFALAIGHAIADFPLQTEFLAINKNRNLVSKDTDTGKPSSMWIHCLTAHALTHAGLVFLILGPLVKAAALIAFVEFIAHWLLDFVKCEGWSGFNADQAAHYLCKAAYTALIYAGCIA
jgi:hypothetical protein